MQKLLPTLGFIGKVAVAVMALSLLASFVPQLYQFLYNPREIIKGVLPGSGS